MQVSLEQEAGVTVARAAGRLDFTAAEPFQKELESAISASDKGVVVDLAPLEYVSSAGLRAFLVGAKAAKARGVGFAVCNLRPEVQEVFDLTGFGRVVSLHPDRAAAVAALVGT
ncbi:MAG: STAS domain-containing protein [Rhodocyclaceae bacterium]|nr:STAS domain-containing protein [Rhodocyclaceae bacterium]